MKKSQISVTDLIMSVSIFIVLAAFIIYYWSATTSRLDNDVNYEELQLKATRIADQLTKTPGDPSKWEVVWKNDLPHVYSLGLASSDRVLSDKKLFNLSVWADPVSNPGGYEEIKNILNIEGYDFNITVKIKDDILTLLRKFDIRIAYVAIGSHCSGAELEQQLVALFSCKRVGQFLPTDDRNKVRCEMYRSTAELTGAGHPAFGNNFFLYKNLSTYTSNYDLLVMEDAQIGDVNSGPAPQLTDGELIFNFTKRGGFFFGTGKLLSKDRYYMGINYIDQSAGDTVTVTNEYYNARDNGDETFVIFSGGIPPDDTPLTLPVNYRSDIIFNPNSSSFTTGVIPIFREPDNDIGAARWDYYKGRAYYFDDGCETTLSKEVGVASKRIILGLASSLYSTLINSGKVPPKDANVVTVQRDVVFNNKSAVFEFTLWKQK